MSDHSHSHGGPVVAQVELPWQRAGVTAPVALSPLTEVHWKAGATLEVVDGWCVATRYAPSPGTGRNTVVDTSCRAKQELVGRDCPARLQAALGTDVPVRTIREHAGAEVYRLTSQRAVIFGPLPAIAGSLPASGAWASVSLIGPDGEGILNKITAVDLRPQTLPLDGCCQGPIFGVNTLFGRRAGRFDLHVPADAAEFFWEVLLDAGREFGLKAAGSIQQEKNHG
ncbi:MAG: hypothetical protein AB7O62_17030 [Pirellulales bacterium]